MTAAAEVVGMAFGLLIGAALALGVLVAGIRWAIRKHRTFAAIRADVSEVRRRGRHTTDRQER